MSDNIELNSESMGKSGNLNEEAKQAYKRKKKEVSRHPMVDQVKAFYTRYNGDINRISAQTMIPKHEVEKILADENI